MNLPISPSEYKRVYLIGFMGCGKSTLGQIWGDEFEKPFVDLDDVMEDHARMTIPGIMATRGEYWFRREERMLLLDTVDNEGFIATGGGVIEIPENREFLAMQMTLFLDVPWEILWERIIDSERPLIKALGHDELYEMYLMRLPRYRECASYIVNPLG